MKTWTLVWFLIFPPNEAGQVEWEAGQETNLTFVECVTLQDEHDLDYRLMTGRGEIAGHEIYCKDTRGTPVPVEQR